MKYIDIEKEYLEKMKEINRELQGDPEMAHSEADDLLVKLLKELGFEKLVKEYEKVPKWYS